MRSASRSISGAAASSWLISAGVNPAASASATCAIRALRLSLSADSPDSVIDITARRPSAGSDSRLTRPRASSAASVAPIDWVLICSARASAVTVAGPPRSSLRSAADSGRDSSPGAGTWRSRRLNRPTLR